MAIALDFALARQRRFFVTAETTIGTFVKPAATDAVKALKANIGFTPSRKDRADSRQSRSVLARITGKTSVPFSIEKYLLPSGTAGTPPDDHLLLYAAIGAYTNTPATSDVYTLTAGQTIRTVSLIDEYSSRLMDMGSGAHVESFKITATGGDEPKLSYEGWCMGHAHTGTALTEGSTANGASSVVLESGQGKNFNVGSVIQVGTSDGAGAGHQVTAVSTDTLTVTPTISGIQADASNVIPFVTSETTAGSPVTGIAGSLTIDGGSALPILGFELSLANGIKVRDDEAFQEYPTGGIFDYRKVSGQISMRARSDLIIELGRRKSFTARDFVVTLGSGAGTRAVIDLNFVQFDFADPDRADGDATIINLPFTSLGSVGEDELTLSFT